MTRTAKAATGAADKTEAATARAVGKSLYLPEWSEPGAFWLSGYEIEIASERPLLIEKRHWRIQPAGGKLERTRDGEGIGGCARRVEPGKPLRYFSAARLPTGDGGLMRGEFEGHFLDDGKRVTIPVRQFALAAAGGKPVDRQRWDGETGLSALVAAFGRFQEDRKAGIATLDVFAELNAQAAWEFVRECLIRGNFNEYKQGNLAVNEVLSRQTTRIRFAGKYLDFTDVALYSDKSFEELRFILTYREPTKDRRCNVTDNLNLPDKWPGARGLKACGLSMPFQDAVEFYLQAQYKEQLPSMTMADVYRDDDKLYKACQDYKRQVGFYPHNLKARPELLDEQIKAAAFEIANGGSRLPSSNVRRALKRHQTAKHAAAKLG